VTVAAESTTEKGDRNENEAADILGRVYGRGNVDKVARYTNNDPLRFLDVIGAKEGWPVRFVQVKSNRFTADERRRYASTVSRFPDDVVCEVWVRVDYEGWRFHRFDGGEWTEYLSMETCDTEKTVEAFREAVGYYDRRTAQSKQVYQDE
jgi:hypothetical protein